MSVRPGSEPERFWPKVEFIPFHECWEWTGSKDRDGYGLIGTDKGTRGAHRISYEISTGKHLGKEAHVLHKCDNPSCVNPQHLFSGSHSDNMQDKLKKGRDQNQIKTHCSRGHAFEGANLAIRTRGNRKGVYRSCRMCNRAKTAARRLAITKKIAEGRLNDCSSQ